MLKLEHISKTFNPGTVNEKKALSGLSLHLEPGDFVTIVGSNGAGKSTLFNAIAGGFYVDEGSITLAGEDITFQPEYRRSRVLGRLFQDPMRGTAPHMTIEENLALAYLRTAKHQHAFFSRTSKADRALFRDQLARLEMGLEDRMGQPVGLLSGGQRQKIGIARALALSPKFIVCDEPISALDVSIQAQIVNLLIRLQKEKGLTYLFIAHDLAMVKHISDRVAVMYLGNIVEITQASALYANPMHPYTQALLSAIPIPDPEVEEKKQRIRLEGELPSPVDPPEGCRFINRCRFASERCRKERPELLEMEPGHLVACHYCEEMKKGTVG